MAEVKFSPSVLVGVFGQFGVDRMAGSSALATFAAALLNGSFL